MPIATQPVAQEDCVVLWASFRISPATAGSVDQIVADETVLEVVTSLWFRQTPIIFFRDHLAAVRKAREWDAHQRYISCCDFRCPHAIALRLRPHQNIQIVVFTL